jgi:hypothetical protein
LLGKSTGGGLGCNTNSVIKTLNRLNQARSRLGRWNAYSDHAQVHAKIHAEQALMDGVIDNTAILKLLTNFRGFSRIVFVCIHGAQCLGSIPFSNWKWIALDHYLVSCLWNAPNLANKWFLSHEIRC